MLAMCSGGRLKRLGPLLLSLLATSSLLWPTTATILAANTATVTDSTITITVPIDIVEETVEGDADYYRRLWTASINEWWNRGFVVTCPNGSKPRRVVFDSDIEVRSHETGFRYEAHVVASLPGESSLPGYPPRADVHRPGEIYDPLEETVIGHWPEEKRPASIAHEFGHVVGLPDEYEVYTGPDGEPLSRPIPGYEDSIMSDFGPVHQRHIDEVVRQHTSLDELECEPPTEDGGPGGGSPGGGGGSPDEAPGDTQPPGSFSDCLADSVAAYFFAGSRDFYGKEASCSVRVVGCPGASMEFSASFDFGAGQRCPFFNQTRMVESFMQSVPVCCPVLRACLESGSCNVRDLLNPPRPGGMQDQFARRLMTDVFTSLIELPPVPPCLAAYVSPNSLFGEQ
jgi:hypothetical protein